MSVNWCYKEFMLPPHVIIYASLDYNTSNSPSSEIDLVKGHCWYNQVKIKSYNGRSDGEYVPREVERDLKDADSEFVRCIKGCGTSFG